MTFNLKLLSQYRTLLMGVAMLMVLFHHTTCDVYFMTLFKIKAIGYLGVDLFLFVSGIGIYFSWIKDPSIKSFYKKRFLRIMPSYLFFSIVFFIFGFIFYNYSILDFFYAITSLSIFPCFGKSLTSVWFIQCIILLYLITPLFLIFFHKNLVWGIILIFILSLFLYSQKSIFSCGYESFSDFELIIPRLPIFFIGLYVGQLMDKSVHINLFILILLGISLFIGLWSLNNLIFNTGWQYRYIFDYVNYLYLGAVIAPPLCVFLALGFNLFSKFFSKYRYPILSFVGSYSLPIYLSHQRILFLLVGTFGRTLLLNVSVILLSFIIAYFVQNTFDKFLKLNNKS